MEKKYNPLICPVCGEPNQCENHYFNEKRNTHTTCWCYSKKFSKEAYQLITLHGGKNPACICCDCLKKAC